jgi:phosphoribosylglycinamide formyltransferase-1
MTDLAQSPDSSVLSARLVVLVSGAGTNLRAIMDACRTGELAAQIVAVVSNNTQAAGLDRARRAGLRSILAPFPARGHRRSYDRRLGQLVESFDPDWVVLAGWMRLLSADFLHRFPDRVLNLHPALPGKFPGAHAIADAYAAFQRGEVNHTGVMVHLVPDEAVDAGPVIAQMRVPIMITDTQATLEARIHVVEHRLLVEAIAGLLAKPPEQGTQSTGS